MTWLAISGHAGVHCNCAANFIASNADQGTLGGHKMPSVMRLSVWCYLCASLTAAYVLWLLRTGMCDCKGWLGMVPTFVPNSDPVDRRITPRVPACR